MSIVIKKNEALVEIEARVEKAKKHVKKMEVTSPETAKSCSDEIGIVKKLISKLDKEKLALTKPARDAVTVINNQVKVVDVALKDVLKSLNDMFIKYQLEQEAIEQARIEADREAEAARIKKEAEEAEAELLANAEKFDAPELIDTAIEINQEAEAKINHIENKEIKTETSSRGSIFKTGIKKTWNGKVTNMEQFLKWIIRTERFEYIKTVDQTQLNAFAKNHAVAETVNGIECFQTVSTSSRG